MPRERHLTLRASATNCKQLFSRRFGVKHKAEDPPASTGSSQLRQDHDFGLENQQARFRLWIDTLGIFASGNGSADQRLRNDQDMKDVFLGLLHQLAGKLEHLDKPDPDPEPLSDESSSDSSFFSVPSLELSEDEDSKSDEAFETKQKWPK